MVTNMLDKEDIKRILRELNGAFYFSNNHAHNGTNKILNLHGLHDPNDGQEVLVNEAVVSKLKELVSDDSVRLILLYAEGNELILYYHREQRSGFLDTGCEKYKLHTRPKSHITQFYHTGIYNGVYIEVYSCRDYRMVSAGKP